MADSKPQRFQRSRRKGARLPEGTVVVTRNTPYENPFIVSPKARPGSRSGAIYVCVPSVEEAVAVFRVWIDLPENAAFRALVVKNLRGKNLACFCEIGAPCHADVLLEIANEGEK